MNLSSGDVMRRGGPLEDWTVHLIDTGIATNTGGRLKRLTQVLGRETFMATYGDGVSNVDINALVKFHTQHGKMATTTAVRPPARFGGLVFDGDRIAEFTEKPQIGEGWINGGFFVLEPDALEYIADDQTSWEREPMERLAAEGNLMAYRHEDFWQCMDTLRDLRLLEEPLEWRESPLEGMATVTMLTAQGTRSRWPRKRISIRTDAPRCLTMFMMQHAARRLGRDKGGL